MRGTNFISTAKSLKCNLNIVGAAADRIHDLVCFPTPYCGLCVAKLRHRAAVKSRVEFKLFAYGARRRSVPLGGIRVDSRDTIYNNRAGKIEELKEMFTG